MPAYIDRHDTIWVQYGDCYYIIGTLTPGNPNPSYLEALAYMRSQVGLPALRFA